MTATPNESPQAAVRAAPDDPRGLAVARALLDSEAVKEARAHLLDTDERTLSEQIELTEIEAPPFGEKRRGARMAELMATSGLTDIETDDVGNVVGWLPGPGRGPHPIVLSAHLDTVFPPGTDVRVRWTDGRLVAPGIGDDGRGLAGILAVARALAASDVLLGRPLAVVATVGEEGLGDLRGVRQLFAPGGAAADACAFISLDGAGNQRIVDRALGSRRHKARFSGPGGHSWVDWGTANPLHALGDAITRLSSIPLPPGSSLSVGRAGGGTSVNSIPEGAWLEMEVRSESETALRDLDDRVHAALEGALADANARRTDGTGALRLAIEPLGTRPGGRTAADTPLVRAAVAATRAFGWRPEMVASSTDANLPMALGIPAVTIGAGGEIGQAHTLDEWYRNTEGPGGLARALLTILVLDSLLG